MNRIRTSLCFLIGALSVTLATAGIAKSPASENKHFNFTMAPAQIDSTQNDSTVTATINNDNPSGSSAQISSFTLTVNNVSGITIKTADPDPAFGGDILVSADGTSVSVINFSPVKATQSYQLTIHIAGCGDRNTWQATVWSGNNLSGGTYNDDGQGASNVTNVPCGQLACGNSVGGTTVSDLIDTSVLQTNGQPVSRRGPFNEDGSCTDTVKYYVSEFVTNTASNTYLHFRWDDNQRGAAFLYILVDPLGPNPLFGWKADSTDSVNANPIFVAAQACDAANPNFPGSYGKVISDNGGKIIKVDTTTVAPFYPTPTPPFRIAIGPKPMEYMTVTKVNGQTWTVTRGAGASAHAAGLDVMSTPLPALQSPLACFDSTGAPLGSCPKGTYVVGDPARMCYVATPNYTEIFDIGDGYVKPSI